MCFGENHKIKDYSLEDLAEMRKKKVRRGN